MMAEKANRVNPSYNNILVRSKLESAAEQLVTKGNHDYRDQIACPYHKTEDASLKMHNCAQSIVMRRIYLVLEEFVPAYKFKFGRSHKIEELSTARGPIAKRRRTTEPEEVKVCSRPLWISDDADTDNMSQVRIASPPASSTSAQSKWLNDPAPSHFVHSQDDFPALSTANQEKKVHTSRNVPKDPRHSAPASGSSHVLDNKSFPVHATDPRLRKENANSQAVANESFPVHATDPRLRKENTNSHAVANENVTDPRLRKANPNSHVVDNEIPAHENDPRLRKPSSSGNHDSPCDPSTSSLSPRSLECDDERPNQSPSAEQMPEYFEDSSPPPSPGPKTWMDSGDEDDVPSQPAMGRGMGRGISTFESDDEEDDDFPPQGRGRGRGGRGGGGW